MSIQLDDLQKSLLRGYISDSNDSKAEPLPGFLINDKNQKVLSTIIRQLESCEEFWFSVAFITTSGIASLMNTLIELKERKIKGKILVSKYLNFTQPLALSRIINNFNNIELRISEDGDFHAKSYLFRNKETYNLIVGSSNMTSAALSKNKEWNLKITALDKSYIMRKALKEFKNEFEMGTPVDDEWIKKYDLVYKSIKYDNLSKNKQYRYLEKIQPNKMQKEALDNLDKLRKRVESFTNG